MAYPFSLPELGYANDALEPHIDARTMKIHRGKHHAAYTANLNGALAEHPDLHGRSAEHLISDLASLPDSIRGAVRNNGGGYVNHALFWEIMTPGGASAPHGELAQAINHHFGDFAALQQELQGAGVARFGSGWAWLCVTADGGLRVCSTPNQDSPIMNGETPIMGVDVWEHAYYLRYQNRRPDYLAAWWNVVNWDQVAARYQAATRS